MMRRSCPRTDQGGYRQPPSGLGTRGAARHDRQFDGSKDRVAGNEQRSSKTEGFNDVAKIPQGTSVVAPTQGSGQAFNRASSAVQNVR